MNFTRFALLLLVAAGQTAVSVAPAQEACLSNQWVRSLSDRRVVGEVVLPKMGNVAELVPDAEVQVIGLDGTAISSRSDSKGRFTLRGVTPGIYTLAVRSEGVNSISALHVLDPKAASAVAYPDELIIGAARVGDAMMRETLSRYVGTSTRLPAGIWDDIRFDKLADKVCTKSPYRVVQLNGGMAGRVYLPGALEDRLVGAADTNVFIMRDGVEIKRTVTDAEGDFAISDLPVGGYAVMAASDAGLVLMGFELVADDASLRQVNLSNGTETLVLQGGAPAGAMSIQLAPPAGAGAIGSPLVAPTDVLIDEEIVGGGFGTPAGGFGGFGGGGFSGGGGGFAGGGLGGIAALAGIGGIIAAVASDDDENEFTPVPVPNSPAAVTP